MKYIYLILFSILIISCNEKSQEFDEKFINTYRDILVVRGKEPDSSKANKLVADILNENGYTHKSFADEYMTLAKDNDRFITFLDSLRNSIITLKNEQDKKDAIK